MIYAVLFEDNDDKADERPRHVQAHLGFLEANAGAVTAAGPVLDTGSGQPAGGLWLVEAASSAEVRKLVETDPFWTTGLRKSVRVLEWKQVFAAGKRLI